LHQVDLCSFFSFSIGPIYRFIVDRKRAAKKKDEDYVEDPFEGQYSVATDDCVDKIDYGTQIPTANERFYRRLISVLVFVSVLVLQGVINYYAQKATKSLGDGIIALVLSSIIRVVNFAWSVICRKLTEFEKHLYYSDHRRWDCFKMFVFKVLNVLVLFYVKRLEILNSNDDCPLRSMANQFAILILFDISVTQIFEIGIPYIQAKWLNPQKENSGDKSYEDSKPQFILSDEYVEIVYRQFLVGLGFFVFPLLPLLALLGSLIEYWADKFRLLRVAGKPKRTNQTYKNVLTFFFFFSGLGLLLGYPNGAIWILSGSAGLEEKCSVYAK